MSTKTEEMVGKTLAVLLFVVLTGGLTAWCGFQKWKLESAPAREIDLAAVQHYGIGAAVMGVIFFLICICLVPEHYRYWDGKVKQARARKRIMTVDKSHIRTIQPQRTTVRYPPRR